MQQLQLSTNKSTDTPRRMEIRLQDQKARGRSLKNLTTPDFIPCYAPMLCVFVCVFLSCQLVYRWVFHEAGLRESLAYLDKSGSYKREFRSTNVAYLNAS